MATHEQYRSYQPHYPAQASNRGYAPASPQQQANGQLAPYHPTAQAQLAPHQQQAYHQNQAYQQNEAALAPFPDRTSRRRSSTPESRSRNSQDSRGNDPDWPPQEDVRIRATGGPLAGAAGGAMIGANVGGGRGYRAAGTIGGMLAGAYAGNQIEKKFKTRRGEQQRLQQEANSSNESDRAQLAQDRYDVEYTKVAMAAPGYGSSLLPSDKSHGGPISRNARSSAAS